MITRSSLIGIIVLLAGLACGYYSSLAVLRQQEVARASLPDYFSRVDIPSASIANLSSIYELSKEQFQEVLGQSQEAISEAARRRNVLVQSRDRVTMHQEAYEQLILQADQEVDLLRLKDYYTQFYMHYFRWLDTGDLQNAIKYKLALGQFKATLDFVNEKYSDRPAFTIREQAALKHVILIAEQTGRVVRWARVVVVVLIFLLVMGIPRLIRDHGYKRFSASLYFDGIFRPRLLSDLNKWHSIKRLAAVLLVCYLFGMVLLSFFVSWIFPLVLGFLGLLPVFLLILISGEYRKIPEMLVTFMAPKVLILILLLGVVALRGSGLLWYLVWGSDLYRGLIFSLAGMLLFRQFQVNVILVRIWSRRNRAGSAATAGMALGIQFLIAGALMYAFGPENSLHALNQELLLLPGKLLAPPILQLRWLMIISAILTAGALLVFVLNRRKLHVPSRSA